MEAETKRLMIIAATDNDPETKRLAGMCAVFDLEKAGEYDRLWLMQSDKRLEREVGIAAGLAAVDALIMNGKTMKLMFMRGCSPFPEVNVEIRLELEKLGLAGGRGVEQFRRRAGQVRYDPHQPRRGEIART
jgi:hypothetical protein